MAFSVLSLVALVARTFQGKVRSRTFMTALDDRTFTAELKPGGRRPA